MKSRIVLTSIFCASRILAAPIQAHQSGGVEHIVIIDMSHPQPPLVHEVLERLALTTTHPDIRHIYNNSAFQGFAASMKSHCLDLLANMSDVSLVEKATSISRAAPIPISVGPRQQPSLTYQTRPNAPWGLQQISTSTSVGGNSNAKAMDYTYSFANGNLGQGADIYIVDTGILTQHSVFGGRAKMLWSFDGNMTDSDGHGTHVAGTAGGAVLGVASNANIFGIKALDADGGGWSSNVIAGIDTVIQTHDARRRQTPEPNNSNSSSSSSSFVGSVMSMSLASSSPVIAINTAITAAVVAGIHVVVAAGNDATDACTSSPASAGGTQGPAIAVGSIGITAQRSTFSNYGTCVDIYAPGENVISAWPPPQVGGSQSERQAVNFVNALSGTSMATPHVTGIVAYAMGNATLAGDPGLMKEWVRMMGVQVRGGTGSGSGSGSSGGVVVANNGVRADSGEGILGFEKIAAGGGFRMVGG
ncbi:hypothetical protein LTR78_009523 [Recurvomyces mirabilis]|uniref:Peptidase S8/S53 domain-containing protein n=1 Tax=Recurvomyces mirabilis TaxID=574656 RepID=A0AAE0WIF2_9PEZI|nr:hypothetical protein LTR78_009523 [Recurvomyces mirabilis]KAK5150022.1 hypothetical protein LTS14_010494 [Recurvomyces mirabilis]